MDCILFLKLPVVHQNEFLDPLARVNFPGIEIAARIRHYLMKPMKLPGIAAIVPCLAQDSTMLSLEGPDDVVLAVGYQQKLLVLVSREYKLPDRTVPSVSGRSVNSLTNLPGLENTCMRSLTRSHTYTRPSREM